MGKRFKCKKCEKIILLDELECVGCEDKSINQEGKKSIGSVYIHKNCGGEIKEMIDG